MNTATVIGAGLAGCEAAWQLANRDIRVRLCEMKPFKKTPAHVSDDFAELVCSNSLRSNDLSNAVGLLKEEMRRLGSVIMAAADSNRVEAGSALAVDRLGFARTVSEKIRNHQNIEVIEGEVVKIPEGTVIIATGPLTSEGMINAISEVLGGSDKKYLNFYDAAAPIVTFESINMDRAFFASRYDRGTPDYINCPMTRDEYTAFHRELCTARQAQVHGFEDSGVFEGCMPVEVMARRGLDTLRYGPLKPRGLTDPSTGREPYAVVQLRKDNFEGSLYNIVGFQTHLTFGEQKRVFSMIPALDKAEYVRYGVMHRNTYIDSPRLLDNCYRLKARPEIRFAGQVTGVEGYVESAASGLLCGLATARELNNQPLPDFTKKTAIGALAYYISDGTVTDFQPMNINFGIISPLNYRVKGKRNKNAELSQRSLEIIDKLGAEVKL
jgi:methylenetetrahydrofolate--tRNA-(uracil-5-)-methyltransferase